MATRKPKLPNEAVAAAELQPVEDVVDSKALEVQPKVDFSTLEFDGQQFKDLSFGMRDIALAERELGMNLLSGAASIVSEPSFTSVIVMLYVALKRRGATWNKDGKQVPYSVDDVADRLDPMSIPDTWAILLVAFRRSSMRGKPENPPQAPAAQS